MKASFELDVRFLFFFGGCSLDWTAGGEYTDMCACRQWSMGVLGVLGVG